MQNNIPNPTSENEIELQNVVGRVSGFFNSILESFFQFFQTLLRYKWLVSGIVLAGIGLGIWSEISPKPKFKNVLVVAANYNSNEYLYTSVDNFRSLVNNASSKKDSLLLSKVSGIEVEPIPNAYEFLLSNYQNLQAFKVMSDRGIDLEKYFKSKIAEKNYRYHQLSFTTSVPKDSTDLVIDHLLSKLNDTKYFNERKTFEKLNIQNKRLQLQKSVDQLNGIFESFGSSASTSGVNLNDYSNMEELFMSKEYLLNQINMLDVENLENDQVIFNVFRNTNTKISSLIPAFIYLPILFVMLFGAFISVRNKYLIFTKRSK